MLFFTSELFSTRSEGEFQKDSNKAFKVGEKLTFDVKYGFVTAGEATFQIPKMRKISGRDAYHVTLRLIQYLVSTGSIK
jgi:hypothetical protein